MSRPGGADRLQLVLVGGLAGVGKTTLAACLAARTGWALLDKDPLTRPFVEALAGQWCGDPDDRESDTYRRRIRPLEYRVLLDAAGGVLAHGCSVIVVAPFLADVDDPAFDARLAAVAGGADIRLVWVSADPNLVRLRLQARGAGRDRGKLAGWEAYLAAAEPRRRPRARHDWVVNDTFGADALDAQAGRLLTGWQQSGGRRCC